jgi:hypothetical protein
MEIPDLLKIKKSYILFLNRISFDSILLLFEDFNVDNDLLVNP